MVALNLAPVLAVVGYFREPIQQLCSGYPRVMKPDATVIDAVESQLESVVFNGDAGERLSSVVADRNYKRVYAVVSGSNVQLSKHDHHFTIDRRVADKGLS
jgi:hypothetical protein